MGRARPGEERSAAPEQPLPPHSRRATRPPRPQKNSRRKTAGEKQPEKTMAATRAGMRVAAISSDRPRWLDGSAGSGPRKRGAQAFAQPGGWPSLTETLFSLPPRQSSSRSRSPGASASMTFLSCASLTIAAPSAETMMSPPM